MSQAQHTPGPWAMTADGSGFYVEGGNLLVAVAQEVDKHSPDIDGYMAGKETEANARLIAAAPELLEAAKMVLAWHDAETDPSGTTFWERVEMCRESEDALRTAVEKATGEAK